MGKCKCICALDTLNLVKKVHKVMCNREKKNNKNELLEIYKVYQIKKKGFLANICGNLCISKNIYIYIFKNKTSSIIFPRA